MVDLGIGAIGLILMVLAVVMFLVAIPRNGEVVGFLRRRENVQAFYSLALIFIFFFGAALVVRSAMS